MTISKAQWDTDGENVRLSMPFSKVDVERRIVSGFATLDNVDKQADIVTSDASVKAFSKFRGNIREMHGPVAVGKMVSFKEDKYFDPETKKMYNGVFVSAYVSKGAQDTWEKVLDGTLSGFSIGGKMNKWDDAYDEKINKKIRIIKEYDLVELSLVDNPANQFANIMSIEKNAAGELFVKGEIAETVIENVFWDRESGIVLLSESDAENSPVNGAPMENIGFVEKTDNEKTEMIKFLVDSAKGINTEINKEVSPMTEENTETMVEETVVDEVVTSDEVAPEADATIETDVEKSEDAEVEKTDDMDEDDMMDDEEDKMDEEAKKKAYKDKKSDEPEVSKSDEAVVNAIADIRDGIASAFSDLSAVVKSLNDELAELKKSVGHVSAKLEDAETDFNEFGKRMEAVEAETAFRKSGDLGEIVQDQPEKVEKSLWGGRFLKTTDLKL